MLGMDDVGALSFHVLLQSLDSLLVSVFIGFIDDFVTAFHRAQFADPQILLEPLQAFKVFLETLDQVIRQSFLAAISVYKRGGTAALRSD